MMLVLYETTIISFAADDMQHAEADAWTADHATAVSTQS